MPIDLIEFPADDHARARQFWEGLLGLALDGRSAAEGQGSQSHGVEHARRADRRKPVVRAVARRQAKSGGTGSRFLIPMTQSSGSLMAARPTSV